MRTKPNHTRKREREREVLTVVTATTTRRTTGLAQLVSPPQWFLGLEHAGRGPHFIRWLLLGSSSSFCVPYAPSVRCLLSFALFDSSIIHIIYFIVCILYSSLAIFFGSYSLPSLPSPP
eukprot:gene9515-6682_t